MTPDPDDYTRVGLLYLLVCVAFAALASGCGLPLPLDGAERCDANLWRAPAAAGSCDTLRGWRQHAMDVTGVDLRKVLIYYSDQPDAGEVGHPEAWGVTQNGTVYISNHQLPTLVHEAYHVAGDSSHCNWSHTHMPLFEAQGVAGEFRDDCAHVTCYTRYGWDVDGVHYGSGYFCS